MMNETQTGGQGALVLDEHHKREHLRMIEMSVRRGWAIRDQAFTALPDAMLSLALDKGHDPRVRVAAGRVVVIMHGQNKDDEEPRIREHHHVHDLGPVTLENMEDRKRALAARLDALGDDSETD